MFFVVENRTNDVTFVEMYVTCSPFLLSLLVIRREIVIYPSSQFCEVLVAILKFD